MKSFRDVELLSVYLDGRLNPSDAERARLESRIASDPQLRAVMDDLRAARSLLRQLPQRRAPRNFTLTRKMAGLKAPEPRAYPTLRLASVLATFLFVATFAINSLTPTVVSNFSAASAPQPAYGPCTSGCGGGGAPETAPQDAQTQTPMLMAPNAALVPNSTPEVTTSLLPDATPSSDTSIAPTPDAFAKSLAPGTGNGQPAEARNEAPVPFVWQIVLAVIAIIFGVSAWLIRRINENKIRRRWK